MKKHIGFTLAEVLITLVIIGVVAALTIPNLMQKYTEQATVKKVQKFYSNLTNAYSLATKEHGAKSEWGLKEDNYDAESAVKIYEILLKPYFKVAENCGFKNTGKCLAEPPYRSLNKTSFYNNYGNAHPNAYKIILDDGSMVFSYTIGNTNVAITYDTNGAQKGPNQWGLDVFIFFINTQNKLGAAGTPAYTNNYQYMFQNNCNPNGTGSYCAAWVVYKGNMDYLHCSDLSWDGKDKCK